MKIFLYKNELYAYIEPLNFFVTIDQERRALKANSRKVLPRKIKEEELYSYEEVFGESDYHLNYIIYVDTAFYEAPKKSTEIIINLVKDFCKLCNIVEERYMRYAVTIYKMDLNEYRVVFDVLFDKEGNSQKDVHNVIGYIDIFTENFKNTILKVTPEPEYNLFNKAAESTIVCKFLQKL